VTAGKQFETDFRQSVVEAGINLDRFYDVTTGYLGIRTVCDFLVYRMPTLFYFELKSVQEPRFPFANVTDYQYTELSKKAQYEGVYAGILIQFRLEEGWKGRYLDVRDMEAYKQDGQKSLSVHDDWGIDVSLRPRRTRCSPDIVPLLDSIERGGRKCGRIG